MAVSSLYENLSFLNLFLRIPDYFSVEQISGSTLASDLREKAKKRRDLFYKFRAVRAPTLHWLMVPLNPVPRWCVVILYS